MNYHFSRKIIKSYRDINISKIIGDCETVVFTNGCFDLLHPGHLYYLKECSQLGDKLIIGLNSDESVQRLKGISRPVNNFDTRANMLSYFSFVHHIIGFEEDTPLNIIKKIKPKILIKGGDYDIDKVIGAEYVIKNGGEIKLIPFVKGYSSTAIINKIKINE